MATASLAVQERLIAMVVWRVDKHNSKTSLQHKARDLLVHSAFRLSEKYECNASSVAGSIKAQRRKQSKGDPAG